MISKNAVLVILLTSFSSFLFAQETTLYTEANEAYKRGIEFYNDGIFGLAKKEFKTIIDQALPINEPSLTYIKTSAELHFAKCAVRLNHPDGEKLILDFARKYDPDPAAVSAVAEMADYFYNAKEYEKAIELYSQIDPYDFSKKERAEIKFKQGYSYFVRKKFKEARASFREIKDIEGDYFYPANYYFGMTAFFENQYNEAISSFQKAGQTKKYKPHVPYYVTQIYFSQGEYDKVITYGTSQLKSKDIKKRAEINQLLGQAYFEKGDYATARPYLEEFAENSSKLRKEDFYQLAFTQYQAGEFQKAGENFQQLNKINSKMGQNAMYLLGDCRIKTNDKASARNAFKVASKMDFDKAVKEESQYNYAKLSYELNFDREAVGALQEIPFDSKYHAEAQTILSAIFLNTRDYVKALEAIEKIPTKTPKMRETYQKVAYLRGLQLHKASNNNEAVAMFNKSLETPIDNRTKALSHYWLGEISHQEKSYDSSKTEMNKFLALTKTVSRLPDESSIHTANYTQGYNYLKQKNYATALGYFQDAVAGIKGNAMYISNDYVRNDVLGDAVLRAGDCLFKRNKYDEAIRFYNEAVENEYNGYVYALYQKAIIEGLRGNTTDKILALDNIVEEYPTSEFADNSLLQLGITYQEIGKFDKAATPLKELIEKYPNSDLINPALLKLGLISYNQGSYPTAINYYKRIFSNNPDASTAQAALTALQEIYVDDLGKPDDYFAFLETIPGYDVKEDEREAINFKSAETQFENGNYEKAIEGYSAYLRKYPNGRNLLVATYHRAESHSVLKQYSKALEGYEEVIQKGQSKYLGKSLKKAALIAYNHEEDFTKSYTYYNQLIKVVTEEDEQFEAQLGALRSAYRIGNADAVAELGQKVAGNSRATDAQRAAANFYLGKIAFDQKDYDTALSAFNEVTRVSDNEQTAEARYSIAYIYYVKRDLEIAQKLCLNANRESGNYPYWVAKSVLLLADILAEKGDLFNAQAALESLLENYDEDEEIVSTARAKLEAIKAQSASTSRLTTDTDVDDDLEMDEEQ